MVAGVGSGNIRISAACFPIKIAAVNDHTAESSTVTADKFGCRMNDDVRTMLDRTDEIRGAEGVVDHQRKSVLMCDLGDSVDIGNVGIRITERFKIDRLGVILYRALYCIEIMSVYKAGVNAVLGQGVRQ